MPLGFNLDRDELERLLRGAGTTLANTPLIGGQSIAGFGRYFEDPAVQWAGEQLDRPGGALRSYLEEGQSLLSPRGLRATYRGFTNPDEYGTGDILQRRGVSDAPLPGFIGSRLNLSARDVAGGIGDMVLDPLNLVPIGKGGSVAARGARAARTAADSEFARAGVGAVRRFSAEERAADELLPDTFEGAVDAVKRAVNREMSLRRRGVVQSEVSEGRQQQAKNVRRLFEEGRAQGLQGAELADYARQGRAVGPLRRTVTEALDVTPEQELQLYNRIHGRYAAGEIQSHDQANAAFALNKLIKGEGIQPHERRLLRQAIPELVGVIDEGPPGYVPPVAKPRRGSSKFLPGEEPDIAAIQARLPGGGRPQQGSARGLPALQKSIQERLFPEAVEEARYTPLTLTPRAGQAGRSLPESPGSIPRTGTALPDAAARPARAAGFAAGDPLNPTNLELDRLRDIKVGQIQGDQFPTFSRLVERATEVATKLAPEGKSKPVADIIARWLNGSVAQVDQLSKANGPLIESWNKHVLGGTQDSAINAAFYQRNILHQVLSEQGLPPEVAQKVTDDLFQALISRKWDPQNVGHYPAEAQAVFDELKGIPYEQSWAGFDKVVQQMKNTAFGLDGGLSVFGQQGITALWRGSPQLFFASLNRAAGLMHLPGARELYMGANLPKATQAALDGVHFGAGSSPVQGLDEIGTILDYVPLIGRGLDKGIQQTLGRTTQFFMGTAMTKIRHAAYEGGLYMDALAGLDITDPLVRKAAADNANTIGSFARSAVRASRAAKESRAVVSPAMSRARIAHIRQMARLIDVGHPEQQVAAAGAILSTVAMPLLAGKLISDWFGVGEFQWDPTQPGWGQITLDSGRVIDIIPQDSVISAVRKSVDALAGKDPEKLAAVWTQFVVSQGTHPVHAAAALAGVGYEPGSGFRMGDLTRTGGILSSLPIPPAAVDWASGKGLDAVDAAVETFGFSTFKESATALERRVLGQLGLEYDQLTAAQRRDALHKAGYLNEIEAKRSEERHELAKRGDRKAMALLVGEQTRQKLDEAMKLSTRPDGTLSLRDYRERRSAIMAQHVGASAQYRDIFDGFSESENPTERLVGQYWDSVLGGSQNPDGSLDFDKFDQLEAEFAARVGQDNYNLVMNEVHALDPRDNPAEQRLQTIRQELDASGYWNLRDQSWELARKRIKGAPATLEEYADGWITERAQRLSRRYGPEVAYEVAAQQFQGSGAKRRFDSVHARSRTKWTREHRALAQQAMAAGYLATGKATLRAAA